MIIDEVTQTKNKKHNSCTTTLKLFPLLCSVIFGERKVAKISAYAACFGAAVAPEVVLEEFGSSSGEN